MLYNHFLMFQDGDIVATAEKLFVDVYDTFTIEFWVYPKATHTIDAQTRMGIISTTGQRFVIAPVYGAYRDGNNLRAGVGVSIGTNGVSVYEHTQNYLCAVLTVQTELSGWTHIAVVYHNRTPSLYINGTLARKGFRSVKKTVVPSGVFGGMDPYGFYNGYLSEVRIWSVARTKADIRATMNKSLTGNEEKLFSYWRLNEGIGTVARDAVRHKNCTITGAKWKRSELKKPSNTNSRILFTFYIPSGGIETLNRQRFKALKQRGITSHFLYMQSGNGLQNKMDTSIFVTYDDEQLKDIIKQGDYEAIIVNFDLRLLQKIRELGYNGFLIYENQGFGLDKVQADQYLQEHAKPILDKYCDAILYPKTPHLIEIFERHLPHKKKFCFQNCFDSESFQYRLHPKYEKPIIGWVGRIEENKNWKDFLEIGARLRKDNPDVQLWMFEDNTLGDQKEREAFMQKINELHLATSLTIYANQPHDRMADYFSIIGDSGGFLCSTSKMEGFGYAVLEALICKCPVLSTDSDGVRSFIEHNVTGKFFELGNIEQAVEEAKQLMENQSMREEIRRNAFTYIREQFSLKAYADHFFNMLLLLRKG